MSYEVDSSLVNCFKPEVYSELMSIFKEFDLKIIDYNFHYNYKDILNEANNSDNVFIIGNTYAYHELYNLNKNYKLKTRKRL